MLTLFQDKSSEKDLTQWMCFWIICISYAFLERMLLFPLKDYLPLYWELKTLGFLWLTHPDYLGALWLWHSKLKVIHSIYDKDFYPKFLLALGPLGKVSE